MEQAQKTIDCLKRYLAKLNWGTTGCTKDREPIMKFVEINDPRTVHGWLIGTSKPIGLRMVKVRYFLEQQGNKIYELEKLDRKIYALGKLIAFGALDFPQVFHDLGYLDERSLLDILHGRKKPIKDKFALINQLLQKFAPKPIAKEPSPSKIPLPVQKEEPSTNKAKPQAILTTEDYQLQINPELEKETIGLLKMLKENIKLLRPRLAHFISDEVSPEKRGEFRDRAGKELVSVLTSELGSLKSQLNSMCSEKARELNLQNTKQEVK